MMQKHCFLNEDYATAIARGKVAPSSLAHVAIKTSRFDENIQWYQKLLNAEVVFSSSLVCFLSYDEEHHRVALINSPELDEHNENCAGVDHISFTYPCFEMLIKNYYRLIELGLSPYWTILHGPTLSLYYRSPDNLSVELQIDVFETEADCLEWFKTGAYEENPIGIVVDIEEMYRSYQQGVALSELLKRRKLATGESFLDHIVS